MERLKEKIEHNKVGIQAMTKLTKEVIQNFTVVPTKEVSCNNEFILQIKEAMKTTLDNHANCIIYSYWVLLPRLLEVYENDEIWKDYLQ